MADNLLLQQQQNIRCPCRRVVSSAVINQYSYSMAVISQCTYLSAEQYQAQ
jgi:hypothetical protein